MCIRDRLYLSCPPTARKVLLNSTRALADELKEMVQTAGVDPDEHLELSLIHICKIPVVAGKIDEIREVFFGEV